MNTNTSIHILDFIRHLLSATANASLYGMTHPQVGRLSGQACDSILKALETRQEFSLVVIDDELIIDGQAQDTNLILVRFARMLKSRGIGHIKVLSGISQEEVNALIAGLARQGAKPGEIAASEHLRLGRVEVPPGLDGGDGVSRPGVRIPDLPAQELERFMDIYEAVKHRRKLKVAGINEIVSGFVEAFRQEGQPLLVMAGLRDTDEYTFTHSTNVCVLNLAQAMSLGIEGQLLNDIGVAAMLHDIGKLFIPEEILTKTGCLTDKEFEIMSQHPVKGARYLLETPGVPRLAVSTAFEHHMKLDFSGYPKVPSGWQQNICSQMTMISDFFDALRTRRSYHEPLELREIAGMMLNMMGTALQPVLTRNFLLIMSRLMETGPEADTAITPELRPVMQ